MRFSKARPIVYSIISKKDDKNNQPRLIDGIVRHLTFEESNPQNNLKIKPILEIACFNLESALAAQRAGADRIELCDDYASGGITPPFDTISKARQLLSISLYVMIRPRRGNFIYSGTEIDEMKTAILFCKKNGVDGIVFGILTEENKIDTKKCSELIKLAEPMQATLHRAFDRADAPMQTLEDAIHCGFTRILTSGQKHSAPDGATLISELIIKCSDRISIMPGGGVRAANIVELKSMTSAKEFHSSALTADHKIDENEIRQMKKLISL